MHSLLVTSANIEAIKRETSACKGRDLRGDPLTLLELLVLGFCSPLKGYLGKADCAAVMAGQRLADGTPWPLPILLEVDASFAGAVKVGERIALRDPEGTMRRASRCTPNLASC